MALTLVHVPPVTELLPIDDAWGSLLTRPVPT